MVEVEDRTRAQHAERPERVHVSTSRCAGGGDDEKKPAYLFNYQRYRINSLIERQMASIVSG